MAHHYHEAYAEKKQIVIDQLKKFIEQKQSGELPTKASTEIKQSQRVLRSLMLSTDATWEKFVDQFLDKDYVFKEKRGNKVVTGDSRIEQFKNVGRGVIERDLPSRLRLTPSDRIHHGTPLEIAAILEDMPADELLNFLVKKEEEGVFFADSDQNTRGQSFDEREHTGARPKASKGKIVYPNQLGPDGKTEFSAHPRGTRDQAFNLSDRPTTAAVAENLINPLLEQNAKDQNLGRQVAAPRRDFLNTTLADLGEVPQGTDVFSSTIDDATLNRVRPLLSRPDIQEGAAKAFRTPLRLENGVIRFNSIDPIGASITPLLQNPVGSVLGAVTEGYNKETIQKLEQGDVAGAATDTAVGAITGAVLETGIKKAGLQTVAGKAVGPLAGFSLFNEGRPGSTTDYVVNKYGPKVGMNQNRPSWGTAIGQPNTQKPAMVQGVEDALDSVGNEVEYQTKQAFNFFKGLIPSGGSIKLGY